ncbi:type II toxin-antitoxin system HicB family antitoxin [Aquidulcibacter sp.]|jgi:predicted RNase H-like HicB family nuclease|uniref:type II toxin-antitoxin system HicB family antitoxin n=1 Tax=Aquidulcibacter sp. TaxID=2052990 RepID=UPI0022BE6F59|nr:type II toxin-antitoxin system HicB family antitoxin [Aquidulcibacter sp.]
MTQNITSSRPKWSVAFDHDPVVGMWGAVVLDLPGCTSGGDSLEEARSNVREAIALYIADVQEETGTVPSPLGLESILRIAETDADMRERLEGAIVLESDAGELKSRSVRVQITMNEGLLARVDQVAESVGMNRSAWLAEAARRLIA